MGIGGDFTISVLAVGSGTHQESLDLCLTARAFGAAEITLVGRNDPKLLKYMNGLNKKWGGSFRVKFVKNYKDALKSASKYTKVYLTRFGMALQSKSYILKTYKNMVLIVSTKDVSKQLHQIADYNISISTQPHCGAAAIAIFLHEFYNGRELAMHFENAKLKLVPSEHGIGVKRIG